MTGRNCAKCTVFKPWEEFYDNPSSKTKKRSECRECTKSSVKRNYPLKGKFAYLERNYGITKDKYMQLYTKQGGMCPICSIKLSHEGERNQIAVVDHCHATGEIRGLLCHTCNSGLGMFKDREESVFRALVYLQRN